jgi:glycerophosphoryl diester phosphodiesterase
VNASGSSALIERRRVAAVAGLGLALPAAAFAARAATRARPGHPYFAGAPLLMAHRGGADLAPENTLLAFQRALKWWESDVLELDVQLTRDGEVVVIHDDTVDRTTDGTGAVAALTLAELRRRDAGYRFTPDGGTSFPFRGRGLKVPTLREVLEAFPRARVNVEIKHGGVQPALRRLVDELGVSHRVLIASGRRRNRWRFADYPGPRSASAEEMYAFAALHHLRSSSLFSTRVDAFQMPEHALNRQVLTPRFVRDVHAHNLPVHIWTINEVVDMQRLLAWGVDGVITDRPDRLARVLHERVGRPLPPGPGSGEAEAFLERLLLG